MIYPVKFFKVIKDKTVAAVGTDLTFACYVESSNRIHICNALIGQYLVTDCGYFHDDWMNPVNPKANIEYEMAEVKQIPEEEYYTLLGMLAKNEKVIDEAPEAPIEKDVPLEPVEQVTIDFVRKNKLAELSKACTEAIESGFDLALSDGVVHHFSMSIPDQLNLATMELMVNAGETDIPYHADGELYQYFGSEDAKAIVQMANKWKTYNVAYYNSMKHWIDNIRDAAAIGRLEYGTSIPTEYCSTVLQVLSN